MVLDDDAIPRTVVCAGCGHRNHDDAHFCQGCGAAVGTRPTSDAQPAERYAQGAGGEPPWYRRPRIVLAVALPILLLAAVIWAAALTSSTDETSASSTTLTTATTAAGSANTPATAAPTPATAPAPAPGPTTAPTPTPLPAPTITGLTPTCDPTGAPIPEFPCSITVTWDHPGGADGFAIIADSPSWPDEPDNDFADGVGATARSTVLTPFAQGIEVCVTVSAERGSDYATSAEQCTRTPAA